MNPTTVFSCSDDEGLADACKNPLDVVNCSKSRCSDTLYNEGIGSCHRPLYGGVWSPLLKYSQVLVQHQEFTRLPQPVTSHIGGGYRPNFPKSLIKVPCRTESFHMKTGLS